MPWECLYEGADDRRIHTLPVGDSIIHIEGKHCPCQPEEELLPAFHMAYKLAVRSRLVHNWIGEGDDGSSATDG